MVRKTCLYSPDEIVRLVVGVASLTSLFCLVCLDKQWNRITGERLSKFRMLLCDRFRLTHVQLKQGQRINISSKGIDDEDMKVFSSALGMGALHKSTCLSLSRNHIGDIGMKAFVSAIESGVLPNLVKLWMYSNQIGDAGAKAFASALESGALPNLAHLNLIGNQIGDAGIEAFASALKSRALVKKARLEVLGLGLSPSRHTLETLGWSYPLPPRE